VPISVALSVLMLLWLSFSYNGEGKSTMQLSRLVVGPLQVNCYIVYDEKTKDAIVIDPGDDAQDILHLVNGKGLKVKYVINTHAHFDHVGANKQLKEATGADCSFMKETANSWGPRRTRPECSA